MESHHMSTTTVKYLAGYFKVSRQTIYNWKAAGCPVNEFAA